LASRHNTEIFTVTVIDRLPAHIVAEAYAPVNASVVSDMADAADSEVRALICDAKKLGLEAGVQIQAEVVAGRAVESIVQAVRNHRCDLLIIGLGRHAGLVSTLLSHTGYDVAERAPCSVLGVR
jgi:nucleotide-binding universal stress UspA family protein